PRQNREGDPRGLGGGAASRHFLCQPCGVTDIPKREPLPLPGCPSPTNRGTESAMSTYLVFGDLHGRILPAFALARAWQREHEEPLAGLLQVGDLGYFPFSSRLDKATKRHAQRDTLELGAQLVVRPSREADELFADPDTPPTLWFIAGNHEDYEALADCYG